MPHPFKIPPPTRALLVLLFSAPFLLFWRWVVYGEVLFWGTSLLQFWPWRYLVKTSLLNGQWPLWNPLLGNGAPLLANLQSAVFYPPNLLYLLLPVEHALTLSIILHLSLAGLLMYSYGRYLGLEPFAAGVAGLSFMLSGYLLGRTLFIPMINAAAWLPLLLLLGDRLATRRRLSDALWLGLILAVQLLAGHAQLWFYSLWLLGPYVLVRSWQSAAPAAWASRLGALGQTAWRLAGAGLLAGLLAAVQILPTLEYVLQSPRGEGAERTFALTYSLWPWRLITLLAPNFFGHPAQANYWGYANYWEDHAYLGVLPLLLAGIAVWRYFKPAQPALPLHARRVAPFMAGLIPVSLILALGWNTPVYLWVFDNIPGFGLFQAPARLLIWYTVAVAVLAGLGAQQVRFQPGSRPAWRRALVASLGLALAGFIGTMFLSGRSLTFLTATRNLGLWLSLAILFLLSRPLQPLDSRETWWRWGVLLFVGVDLLLAGWPLIPTLSPAVYRRPIASAQLLQAQPGDYRFFVDDQFAYQTVFDRYFRFEAFGPRELPHWLAFKETLVPNLGVYAGLPAANNDDPLVVGRWQQLVSQIQAVPPPMQNRLLALMNVGYRIGPVAPEMQPLYADAQVTISPVSDPLPRAYFVSQARYAPDETAALDQLQAVDFDPHREVVIITTGQFEFDLVDSPSPRVELRSQRPAQVELWVDAPQAGFVILTDTFYPGWQAFVDDQAQPIWPANLAFRAVAVESGPHRIQFVYRPLSFTFGLWTSMISCLIMVIVFGYLYVSTLVTDTPQN